MADPLTAIVGLLKPSTPEAKLALAAGRWRVRRTDRDRPFYCAVLEGTCRLVPDGQVPLVLEPGDFVLVPAASDFSASSLDEPPPTFETLPVETDPGVFRIGSGDGPPDTRMLVGDCAFGAPDARLLVSLLPRMVHVRGDGRLTTLMGLVNDETRACRPGREAVVTRLLEVLLIEALRAGAAGPTAGSGLVRGLADERIAAALRRVHANPSQSWTVAELAREAALSRSVFFERFKREVGTSPMEYLLTWRMALARDLLRRPGAGVGTVAAQVGYASASTFSVAFARHTGRPPMVFAKARLAT